MATAGQIKTIQTLRRKQFGNDEQDYRDWLMANFDVHSTKQLNKSNASEAIQILIGGDISNKRGKYIGSGEVGSQRHLTQAQANRIAILENLLGWSESGTLKFIERQIGRPKAVDWLMNFEAGKVIVGMTRVLSNGDQDKYLQLNQMPNQTLKSLIKEAE